MVNWNEDLLKEIEAIASAAELHTGGDSSEDEKGVPEEARELEEVSYYSTSSGVAICRMMYDPEGGPEDFILEKVNPVFCSLFGVTRQNAEGRTGRDFFADGKALRGLDTLDRVLREGETASYLFYLEKFGRVFDILAFSPGGDTICMVCSDASKQASGERERRENQRFTESIFESVDVWITLLDEGGRIVFWNATAERLSGISADEALSGRLSFWDRLLPDSRYRKFILEKVEACRKGSVPEVRIETGIRTANGNDLFLEWTVRIWRFKDTGTDGLLLLGRDVTEIRRLEGELRESERRYAAAFRETWIPMFIVDPETWIVTDCNDAALAFYGYSREEMVGKKNTLFNMQPPEELSINLEKAKTGQESRFIFPHRLKNGEIRTVEVFASPIPCHGSNCIFSIVHDITEKQRLEEQLRLLSFDSSLVAKTLAGILESSPNYLYVFDREGKLRFAGERGAALFHRTPEEMTGLSWRQLGVPEDRAGLFTEHLEQVFSTGKGTTGKISLPAANGDISMEFALNATCRDDGSVDKVFCLMRNVQ